MCDHCDSPSRAKLCPCLEAAYCSEACAIEAWDAHHSEVCTFQGVNAKEPDPTARKDPRMQELFELLQDAQQPETAYKNLFSRIYSPQRYNYIIAHYDRCQKPIMLLDSRGNVGVAVLSSIQRLWRDYFGPWTGARMALLKLPPGFGKTAMGHLLWANYKYEMVSLPEVPFEEGTRPATLPRIPIWVTRPTLIHTVSEDLWAQDDRNPSDIKQTLKDNLIDYDNRTGIAFNKDKLVMSYAQFENLLMGRSAAGRKLWAGLRLTETTAVSSMETYNGVPTAYRQTDEGKWVRGNASHEIDTTTNLRNIELEFTSRVAPGKMETIRNIIANDYEKLINQWKGYTWMENGKKRNLPLILRKAIKNIASVEETGRRLKIVIRWKSRDNIPSLQLWKQWLDDNDRGFRPFAAYRTLANHYQGEIVPYSIWTEPVKSPTTGWKLGRADRGSNAMRPKGREVLSWVPVEPGESEVDFNPLDRLMIIFDEAHNIVDSELIRTALKDSKNVVVVNMSASIDLFSGLRLLDNSLPAADNPSEKALGPARNLPTDIPNLGPDVLTFDELKATLTAKYFDPESNDFKPEFDEISNAFKGVVSVANISEMRDIFAKAVYPEDQQLEVRLSIAHAQQLQTLFMEAITQPERKDETQDPLRYQLRQWVKPAQNTVALYNANSDAPLDLHDRYNLASKAFSKEYATVADTLIAGHSPIFPAARVVLRKLRQLDEREFAAIGKLTKRMLVSSTEDHKFGVIPMATALQAAGYEWLPVELQQPDLAKLSTRARNQLREDRRLGIKIGSQLRKVKISEEPMKLHSNNVDEELKPYSEHKQFVVLSEELINRLLLAKIEDPTFNSMVQDVLDEDPPSLKTAYKFHSTKGRMRERRDDDPDAVFEPFATEDAERSEYVEELLGRIMGKRLYLWPGYREEMDDWASLKNEQMKVLLDLEDPQPFFFVRTQRSIIKLGKEIEELNIASQDQLTLKWPREGFNPTEKRNQNDFNVLLGWLEPAKTLGEDTKKDAQDTILEVFNEMNNIRGTNVRFILLGEGFLEGINVKAVTKVIELEPSVTYTNSLQRRGRAIRRCGHEGLPFDQWRVEFYTVVHKLPTQEYKFEAQLFSEADDDSWPLELDEVPVQRVPKGESEEAKKQRLAESKARTKKETTERLFAYRQLSVLSELGAAPVDWETKPVKGRIVKGERVGATPILDTETTLEPYQAIRMLHEDPRITLVRLRGEQLLDELALDRSHNTLRDKTTNTVRLNTNYQLRTEAVASLIAGLELDMTRMTENTALRERRDGLAEMLNVINASGAVPLIHREIAEHDHNKRLYLLLKNKTYDLQTSLFGADNVPPVGQLQWLVENNFAQWATVVQPAGSSQSDEGEEEDVIVGTGIEDIGTPDEEQEAIERATMTNVFRILYVLGIEWHQETTSLLWPSTEQPDPDMALSQIRPNNASIVELTQKSKSILEELFADDGGSVRSVPTKRVVKRAILDVFRYGVMNWYRGAALLAHILRVRDNDEYWGSDASGDQASKTLTEAQLKRAATLTGALFRLASAPDLIIYLERLRRLGIDQNDKDFGQKAAVVLASVRWFDEIVIKRKASESDTRQGALGLPLQSLVDILGEIQQLGINLNLQIDTILAPLTRSPRAQQPYPTSLVELEQQIRRTKPRPTLNTSIAWLENGNRLFELYVKYERNLTEALEDLSTDLAKRNTIFRALRLELPEENSPENVPQQVEDAVNRNLEAIKNQWPEAEPYTANIIASALLRAFGLKKHFTANPSNEKNREEHQRRLESFMQDATEELGKKTQDMLRFERDQKQKQKAEELEALQNRPTRLTGFNTAQRVLNKTDGVGIERTERKATDVVPQGEKVPVLELLDQLSDGSTTPADTLLIQIDPTLAVENKIRGGLLQSLTEKQSSVTNLPEMYIDGLVLYVGTAPLDSSFFERLMEGLQYRLDTESKQKLAESFTESGVKRLIKELLQPDNKELLQAIFVNRTAESFLKLLQFADVGRLDNGMQILEQYRRATDEFIDEFEGTTSVSTLETRLNRFCSGCNLNEIKHLVINNDLKRYKNYPYYTQQDWDKAQPEKAKDAVVQRSNANILRIAVILYEAKTPEGGRYGSYREHVNAIRRTVAKVEPERIHEKIPGQTTRDNPSLRGVKSRVVFAAFEETIRERKEKFLRDYQE